VQLPVIAPEHSIRFREASMNTAIIGGLSMEIGMAWSEIKP
jgi:hypothetical protein